MRGILHQNTRKVAMDHATCLAVDQAELSGKKHRTQTSTCDLASINIIATDIELYHQQS